MPMKNPPHPGTSIRDACLEPLGLNVTDAAKVLGIARHTLSRVLHGHAGISPDMAIRLEKAGWSNANHWLLLQMAFDLARARLNESRIRLRRYQPRRYEPQPAV
jgi:addiction module HigA family antidote